MVRECYYCSTTYINNKFYKNESKVNDELI